MSDRALVVLSVVLVVGVGALGCYALSSLLVMGGRTALWLEANRWVYPTVLGSGCVLLAVAATTTLWPLAFVGGALAVVVSGRYLWLNV